LTTWKYHTHQHWSVIHLCIVEAVQEMNASRPGGRNTHAEPPGEVGISTGHESGRLFMPDMNEPYPILLLPKGLQDPIDAIAWQTEYGVNAPRE
jgi:hypothetical protein